MAHITKRRLERELYAVVVLLALILTSCHKDDVRYYQREGRTVSFLESEFMLQHELLNRGFKARDSSSIVEVIFLDTVQTNDDTITIRYDYLARLADGEELPLTAPREEIFSYIGKELPDFTLPDLAGRMVEFNDFLDKPVVLNFWFRACTP